MEPLTLREGIMMPDASDKPKPGEFDKKILIVPPGLKERYETFKDHCEVADGAPVVILGATGVGKTLFFEIYKNQFYEKTKCKDKPVIIANCAHFGNQKSDPNIARVELFGAEQGIVHGVSKKKGLIHEADGGILFLEEIGELPIAVQAMLLTFIEDKKFKKVGGNIEETSDCCIVAATNNEGTLREDFKNRFFPFQLPPLYERRNDLLYYLYEKHSDLLVSLFRDEVLELLSYNWPGNVRKIERVALLMKRTLMKRNRLVSKNELEGDWWKLFKTNEIDLGGSSHHKNINLYNELSKIDADVEYLDSLMINYGLSFKSSYLDPDCYPFEGVETNPPEFKVEECAEYTIKIYDEYEPFEKAYEGFNLFCRLFLQNHLDNKNVLRDLTECYPNFSLEPGRHFKKKDKSKLSKLMKKIFCLLSGIELDKSDKWPSDYPKLTEFLEQQAKSHPENYFLSTILTDDQNSKEIPDNILDGIVSFTKQELLTGYYKKLLELSKGNVLAASRKAKIPNSTFKDGLMKYGLKK